MRPPSPLPLTTPPPTHIYTLYFLTRYFFEPLSPDNVVHPKCLNKTYYASRVTLLMLHLSQFTCHAAIVILYVSCFTYLTLSCMLHVSYFMFHASRFTLHTLHISMLHVSCFTFHASRFTLHISCFTFHASCDVTWWCDDMCMYNVFSVSSMLGTCIQQSIQIWEGFAPRSVSSAPLPP